MRREINGTKLKFCLANATPEANLRWLADRQGARHFVEHAVEDAKGAGGMADYPVRGWQAWHQHLAWVRVALMFLAKERLAHRDTANLLPCNDLVEIMIMRHPRPTQINTKADLVASSKNRHQQRQIAKAFADKKHAPILSAAD